MKILKLFAAVSLGFCLIFGLTFDFWYAYPSFNLSFFASGNGAPYIDIQYIDTVNKTQNITIYPQLSATPQLQSVQIKTNAIKSLKLVIKHYEGVINIADVFLSGKNLQNVKVNPSNGLNILNNSTNNISASIQGETSFELCEDCSLVHNRQFLAKQFTLVAGIYALFIILLSIMYVYRAKIKSKLMGFNALKNYALIIPFARPYWFRALLAIVITMPIGAMDAVIAWSLKPFMDVVLVEKQTGWTMYIPLMIVIFSILQALFTYIATYMNTWVGNKISIDIKRKLFNKLLHKDAAFFDTSDSGFVLLRFNRDAEAACNGLLSSMRLFSTRFFSSLSLIIVLFYNSWKLAIVAVVVLVGAFYPLATVRKRLKGVVKQDVNMMAAVMAKYNEAFGGNRVITAYNLFDFYGKKFVETVNNLFKFSTQMTRKTGIVSPSMHFISSFGIAFVIWYGSYLIVTHQITVGNFASFITSLVMLYNPLKSIGNNASAVVFSLMAVDRVFQQLNEPNKIKNSDNPQKPEKIHGNITYQDVHFAYNKNQEVLKNINLEIKPGQTVALVGNSGGGKSTISALLPRFYDITKGAIKIDGINIKDIDLNYLRDNIAIVFQDNFLFGGTIKDNILLGRTDISDEKLQQAIKASCLEEFINSLEHGLDTQIGERGILLSGGQKQRIAIARAFIKNAPILILDEATSALDNKAEAVVQQAIDNLMTDRTVLVIAHRLSTVRNANCIVVVNNGEIVEKGTHEELLVINKEYAALYKTQLS